ncbi:hypothetical protein [Streptomyces sp. NPDC012510]
MAPLMALLRGARGAAAALVPAGADDLDVRGPMASAARPTAGAGGTT